MTNSENEDIQDTDIDIDVQDDGVIDPTDRKSVV